MPELLVELFSEEIPARMQKRASGDLKRLVTDGLKSAGLEFTSAEAAHRSIQHVQVSFASPFRLIVQPLLRFVLRGRAISRIFVACELVVGLILGSVYVPGRRLV